MSPERHFKSTDYFQSNTGDPIRTVVTESPDSVVVAWHVNPGQRIAAHIHPHGQDTWTILSGHGEYQIHANGESITILPGDIVVAPTGSVHGVFNNGSEPLRFISVVAPAAAGYELSEATTSLKP